MAMRKTLDRFIYKAGLLAVSTALAVVTCTACAGGKTPDKPAETETQIQPLEADDAETWAVYWYFCGSDLESKLGAGTEDLNEMLKVKLPDNVKVIFETGGADGWQRDGIDSEKLTRFCYSGDSIEKIDEVDGANMGEAETLQNFLEYCLEEHPADHKMFVFWNHGGGVLGGVSYDELYFMDSLALTDLTNVFDNVCKGEKEFDIVGFDACLMSTVDTAKAICDESEYMIASQELEPGNGWNYTGMFKAFAENPKIGAKDLGVKICDAFMEGCVEHGTELESTLSMIELDKTKALFDAYDEIGASLLIESVDDETVFAQASRAAYDAEHYGQNSNDEGYTNMVDLGSMVANIDFLSEELIANLEKALKESVIYEVRGEYKAYGSGLSIYYPLDNSLRSVMDYGQKSDFDSYQNFYQYQVSGNLSDSVKSYIATRSVNMSSTSSANAESRASGGSTYLLDDFFTGVKRSLEEINEQKAGDEAEDRVLAMLDVKGIHNEPMHFNDGKKIVMEIPEKGKYLTNVNGMISFRNQDGQLMTPGYVPVDRKNYTKGHFEKDLICSWWYLNGHPVYAKPVENHEKYTIYSTPVLYNGEEVFFRFAVNHPEESITILGGHHRLGSNYMAEKNVLFLKEGDEITTLMSFGKTDEYRHHVLEPMDTFKLEKEPVIELCALPDTIAAICFAMDDVWTNEEKSVILGYRVVDGKAVFDGLRQEDMEPFLAVLGAVQIDPLMSVTDHTQNGETAGDNDPAAAESQTAEAMETQNPTAPTVAAVQPTAADLTDKNNKETVTAAASSKTNADRDSELLDEEEEVSPEFDEAGEDEQVEDDSDRVANIKTNKTTAAAANNTAASNTAAGNTTTDNTTANDTTAGNTAAGNTTAVISSNASDTGTYNFVARDNGAIVIGADDTVDEAEDEVNPDGDTFDRDTDSTDP